MINPDASTEEPQLGFKRLTKENWLLPDPISQGFAKISDPIEKISSADFVAYILRIKLSSSTPSEIQKLFAVAQGTLCYGHFFYPLYTLGAEQLFRALETALYERCKPYLESTRFISLKQLLKLAIQNGILEERETDKWDFIREVRNQASHPRMQSIYTPLMALDDLAFVAKEINDLFRVDITE